MAAANVATIPTNITTLPCVQFFDGWTPAKVIQVFSKIREQLNSFCENWNTLIWDVICDGHSIYLQHHNSNIWDLLVVWKQWNHLLSDDGLEGVKIARANLECLAHTVLRLCYYNSHLE